jgi:predicted AlkP superfamily pyrophosphatase or phosphodiesterase
LLGLWQYMACVLYPWNAAATEISSKPTNRFSVNERVVWQWRECAPGNLDFPKSRSLNPFKSMARSTISSNQISLRALLFSMNRLIRVGWTNKTTGSGSAISAILRKPLAVEPALPKS